MSARVRVNGSTDARIAADDRGLLYGDGLFETILFVDGVAPLWRRHIQRLRHGCAQLLLPTPDDATLAREAAEVVDGMARAVVRITLTRGRGVRGYALPQNVECTRIVAAFEPPLVPPDWYEHGIRVRFADLTLASQPRLAGIKHLNRLEQVLVRAEWNDPEIVEALLCDGDDRVICATAANLFIARDGELITPSLDRFGVAGVARAEVLARNPRARVRAIAREELMKADEIFITSSVRGILPVRELEGRRLQPGPFARAMQAHWRESGLTERHA